jgi:hypothetical protein
MSGVDPQIADSPGRCTRQICGTRDFIVCPKGWQCDMSRVSPDIVDDPGICVEDWVDLSEMQQ